MDRTLSDPAPVVDAPGGRASDAATAPTLLLLHGLGANAAVWGAFARLAGQAGHRWLAPDLPGHGAARWLDAYDYDTHARTVADALAADSEVIVVGHSMGAIVGMALAASARHVRVRGIAGFSVKLDDDPAFVERMHRVGARAPRWHERHADAAARFLAFAGLDRLEAVDGALAATGVVEAIDGGGVRYRVATDPRVYLGVGGDASTLPGRLRAPVRLLGGGADPMISLDDMRRIDPHALLLDGLGHNPHVEAPQRLWDAIAPIVGGWCPPPR